MLGTKNVHAIIAVKNLEVAKKFYGETLGLEQKNDNPAGVMYAVLGYLVQQSNEQSCET